MQAPATSTTFHRPHLALPETTGDLLIPAHHVSPSSSNAEVFMLFEETPGLHSLPVVEQQRPVGMINRNVFMESLARPYYRELYLKKSCTAFMDRSPLLVEATTGIEELSFRVLEGGQKVLVDGFIITRDGHYAGIGSAQDMLRAIANLQAARNRMVMESIDYGSVIQRSLSRASREAMDSVLPDHFLLWEPRDVVSGDFYHFQAFDDGFLLILFDCTGHGVPGAFMTLIMSTFLQGAIHPGIRQDPAALLAEVNRRVKLAMGQTDVSAAEGVEDDHSDDGMDAACCWFDHASRQLTFAGAHMGLFHLAAQAAEPSLIDGDRLGVGYATTPMSQRWINQRLQLAPGDAIYLFTDGFLDQLGGERRIAFGKRRLAAELAALRQRPMREQGPALMDTLRAWQGLEPRKDDISAIGFRV